MTTVNITEARDKLYRLVDEAAQTHVPIVITARRGNAVLIAEEDWNAINETLYLLSVPGMRESIRKGHAGESRRVPEGSGLVKWELYFTRQARRDARKLAASGLRARAQQLLDIIVENPFQNPPPYERLVGDLAGAYSRRINIQHRLVYQVLDDRGAIKILRMWTHYE